MCSCVIQWYRINCVGYIMMNERWEWFLRWTVRDGVEALTMCWNALTQHLHGSAKEHHEKSQAKTEIDTSKMCLYLLFVKYPVLMSG
jgi:hypothetical protein